MRRAASRDDCTAGNISVSRSETMEITTSSSISVKALRGARTMFADMSVFLSLLDAPHPLSSQYTPSGGFCKIGRHGRSVRVGLRTDMGRRCELTGLRAFAGKAANHIEEHRGQENAEQRDAQHSGKNRGAQRSPHFGAGAMS